MQLRPYQVQAISATLHAVAGQHHPVIALPTGAGKSLVIAALCQALPGRILVVTHSQELVSQNAQECLRYDSTQDVGVFSAGLRKHETRQRILFASVQSIYRHMGRLQDAGAFRYIMIDEAHMVTPQTADAKQYNTVLAQCPDAQRIGLSATPFRLDDGPIYGPPPCWFDTLAAQVGIRDLTPEYLSPLRGILTAHDVDVSKVHTRHGDYATNEVSKLVSQESVVDHAIQEILSVAARRRKFLVFGVDVAHCELVTKRLAHAGQTCALITGKTPKTDRAHLIEQYTQGMYRFMVNCETLTTGFNVKDIDCLVLLRPTQSKGLLIQMLGRGTRQVDGKHDCLVLDMAGNLERHIPLDEIADTFETPHRKRKREEEQRKQQEQAKAEEEQRKIAHDITASTIDPMAIASPAITVPVVGWYFKVEPSKNPQYEGKSLVKILYRIVHEAKWITTFLCPEYSGWHRGQTEDWCRKHQGPVTVTADTLYQETTKRAYRMPTHITFRKQGKYHTLVDEHWF